MQVHVRHLLLVLAVVCFLFTPSPTSASSIPKGKLTSQELSSERTPFTRRNKKRRKRHLIKSFSIISGETGKPVRGYRRIRKRAEINPSKLPNAALYIRPNIRKKKRHSLQTKIWVNGILEHSTAKLALSNAESQGAENNLFRWSPVPGQHTIQSDAFSKRTQRKRDSVELNFTVDTGGDSGFAPTPQDPTLLLHSLINSGGSDYIDQSGNLWLSDSNVSTSGSHQDYSDDDPIYGTADDYLYQTERWGSFSYNIPLENGDYHLVVHLAEIFWESNGERIFDVSIEGGSIVNGLDIHAQVGANVPLIYHTDISISDGVLNLGFQPSVNNGKISALEIYQVVAGGGGPISSPTPTPSATPTPPPGDSLLTAVWANDGGDKVAKGELRASGAPPANVTNSIWNGSAIELFGARNETVSFNLVLEAADVSVAEVGITLDQLSGPNGSVIQTSPASGDGVFDYLGRNIEIFFVRYLQIKGLSLLAYEVYDERHIPQRIQRPYTGEGHGTGTWYDRPDHDKFYPDIAVPIELVGNFDVQQGENQSIWVDIYIPKYASAGVYSGTIEIQENGALTRFIPVQLEVKDFTLPDTPSSKTMLFLGYNDVNKRYIGHTYPENSVEETHSHLIRDRHFQMAHRHRISLIDSNAGADAWNLDQPRPEWLARLDGTLFTSANGYDGPGVGVGNGVYSIGTYGSWGWQGDGESSMHEHTNNWVNWFNQNAPNTDYFLYLIDESENFAQINQWASWINNNPGPGHSLLSFATMDIPDAVAFTPELDIAAGWLSVGITEEWQEAVDIMHADPGKRAYLYNGKRPASGSFATDDDGIALRELPWGQYKGGIDRWFYWESTYYDNFQGGTGDTNVYQTAATFGGYSGFDEVLGETGWNRTNGDGVLFYPGTDLFFPQDSYGVSGPIASLRLKHWRRGIQDVEYLVLASAINPTLVQQILQSMVPSVLWEPGISDPEDPTWLRADISWSTIPDDWEAARLALAEIIEGG